MGGTYPNVAKIGKRIPVELDRSRMSFLQLYAMLKPGPKQAWSLPC